MAFTTRASITEWVTELWDREIWPFPIHGAAKGDSATRTGESIHDRGASLQVKETEKLSELSEPAAGGSLAFAELTMARVSLLIKRREEGRCKNEGRLRKLEIPLFPFPPL
jgi:hypothetical protein